MHMPRGLGRACPQSKMPSKKKSSKKISKTKGY